MIKRFLQPISILVLLLIIIFLITRECGKSRTNIQKQDTITLTSIQVKHDTIIRTRQLKSDPPDTVIFWQTDTIRDSVQNILNIYNRKLWDDDKALINVTDSVYRNRLLGAHVNAKFFTHDTTRIITKIINTLPPPPVTKLFIGFQTGMVLPEKVILSPAILICTKRDHLYSLGYDPLNKIGLIGMSWKIKLRKHQRDVD